MRPLLFRSPYGARCRRLDQALRERDLLQVGWSIDPQEWKGGSEDQIVEYVTRQPGPRRAAAPSCCCTTPSRRRCAPCPASSTGSTRENAPRCAPGGRAPSGSATTACSCRRARRCPTPASSPSSSLSAAALADRAARGARPALRPAGPSRAIGLTARPRVLSCRPAARSPICRRCSQAARHLDSVNLPNDPGRLRESIERSRAVVRRRARAGQARAAVRAGRAGRRRQRAGGRLVDDLRPARHPARAPHLLRRHRRGALQRDPRPALPPPGAAHRLQLRRPHRDRRPGAAARAARAPPAAGQDPGARALPLHRAAPRACSATRWSPSCCRRSSPTAPACCGRRWAGTSPASRTRRPTGCRARTRSSSAPCSPRIPSTPPCCRRRPRRQIGQVGPHSKAVEKMLVRAGFEYASRIDPFDGGPHFHCRTDDIVAGGGHPAAARAGAAGGRRRRPHRRRWWPRRGRRRPGSWRRARRSAWPGEAVDLPEETAAPAAGGQPATRWASCPCSAELPRWTGR